MEDTTIDISINARVADSVVEQALDNPVGASTDLSAEGWIV
jgi:hypothetical protein